MSKHKNFSRRALVCILTHTHLEGHRSVDLGNHPPSFVRARREQGCLWEYGGSQLVQMLRKAGAARVNRRLLRYYLIVRRLPNVFALACRS